MEVIHSSNSAIDNKSTFDSFSKCPVLTDDSVFSFVGEKRKADSKPSDGFQSKPSQTFFLNLKLLNIILCIDSCREP